MAPMPLTTYEEVRRYATLIKDRVERRIMPPYHADATIGIQDYKNDIRLSREEINTIVRWVDSGTPEGDPADLPPPVEWPTWDKWQLEAELGPPDVVLKSDPITVSILIPPNGSLTLNSAFVLEQPMMIHSFAPHMHTRGVGMSVEAILPGRLRDGGAAAASRRVVLTSVNNYNHNWQVDYVYADYSRPLLPAGTTLLFHSQFDNTDKNPIVDDPDQWVTFGARGVDDMSNARMSVTDLTEAQYERLVAERMQLAKEQMAKPKDQRINVWLAP